MAELTAANDKLREAEFFFMLMEKNLDAYEFKYFLSALLSALYSCTEHNRLHSTDERFKEWYKQIKEAHLTNGELERLFGLRNKEVHHKGTESVQQAGMSFPDGITTTSLELGIDFSSGRPVGRYKSAEMVEFKEHPVQQRWVWKADGEPDVMVMCTKALNTVRRIISSRDDMCFPD